MNDDKVPVWRGRLEQSRRLRRQHRLAGDWPAQAIATDRRGCQRTQVQLVAECRRPGGRRSPQTIVDLTARGCRVQWPEPTQVGTYMWVSLPTLASNYGRVAWCGAGAMGVDFAQPLHPAVAEMILARAQA